MKPSKSSSLFELIVNFFNFISAERRTDWFFAKSSNEDSVLPSIYVPFKYDRDLDIRETTWEIKFDWNGNWELEGEYDCSAEWFLTVEKFMDEINEAVKQNYQVLENFNNDVLPTKSSINYAKKRAIQLTELGLDKHIQYKAFCEDWNSTTKSNEGYW